MHGFKTVPVALAAAVILPEAIKLAYRKRKEEAT
jgi:hypothetical protein